MKIRAGFAGYEMLGIRLVPDLPVPVTNIESELAFSNLTLRSPLRDLPGFQISRVDLIGGVAKS